MAIDFKKFAENVARRGEVEALLPIVEKELIHYDIIRALDESRWLDGLTFQGGTCLRLCYGAVRYSEDLDFTTALDLEESDLAGFRELLSDSLRSKYDVGVRVTPEKDQALRRRWVDEEVAGGRRHGAGATRSSFPENQD